MLVLCNLCFIAALLFSCYLTRQVALGELLQGNRGLHTFTLSFSHTAGYLFQPYFAHFQALKQQQQRNQRRQGGMPTTSSPRLLLKTIKDMADNITTTTGRWQLLYCQIQYKMKLIAAHWACTIDAHPAHRNEVWYSVSFVIVLMFIAYYTQFWKLMTDIDAVLRYCPAITGFHNNNKRLCIIIIQTWLI